METVEFIGITFTGFSRAAFAGEANASTTLLLTNVAFQNYDAPVTIQQHSPSGGGQSAPFQVDVLDAKLQNATGRIAFSSQGGRATLRIQQLIVRNTHFSHALMAMAGHGGSIEVRNALVASSSFMTSVFSVHNASQLRATNVELKKLIFFRDGSGGINECAVYNVTGDGSHASIADSHLHEIHMEQQLQPLSSQSLTLLPESDGQDVTTWESDEQTNHSNPYSWVGMYIAEGASAVVDKVRVTKSSSMQSALRLFRGNTFAQVQDLVVDAVEGPIPPADTRKREVSSVVYLEKDVTAAISGLVVDAISNFTAALFVDRKSSVVLQVSCFLSGQSRTVVYVSSDSDYWVADNIVDSENYRIGANFCNHKEKQLIDGTANSLDLDCFYDRPRLRNDKKCQSFKCAKLGDLPRPKCQAHPPWRTTSMKAKTLFPTAGPSLSPGPSAEPSWTHQPTPAPTDHPTRTQVPSSSYSPTLKPTQQPTLEPSWRPSNRPTETTMPSGQPSRFPSPQPSPAPSDTPSRLPSWRPTQSQSPTRSLAPSAAPSFRPSRTWQPSEHPSSSREPTQFPTQHPTIRSQLLCSNSLSAKVYLESDDGPVELTCRQVGDELKRCDDTDMLTFKKIKHVCPNQCNPICRGRGATNGEQIEDSGRAGYKHGGTNKRGKRKKMGKNRGNKRKRGKRNRRKLVRSSSSNVAANNAANQRLPPNE